MDRDAIALKDALIRIAELETEVSFLESDMADMQDQINEREEELMSARGMLALMHIDREFLAEA